MSVRESIGTEQIERYNEFVTPLKKRRKKNGTATLIFFLVCVVIGAVIGFCGPLLMDKGVLKFNIRPPFALKKQFLLLYLLLLFVLYYIVCTLHTIIHEAGHLVFGLLSGYRFLSFRVFSFTIVKKDGKFSYKKIKVPGTMGQCLMIPPEWNEEKHYPYVWFNLGGGMFNLIFSALSVPLFFLHSPLWAWIAGVFIFAGVIFGVCNVLPMTMGIPNDGKNCLLCAKEKKNQKALYLQLKINAMMSEGVMPDEIPEELLKVDEEDSINALTLYVHLIKCYKRILEGKPEEAEECLTKMEQSLDTLPAGFANAVDAERLYFLLQNNGSPEEIAAYYAVLQPVLIQQAKDLSVLRIKYFYYRLLSEEDRERIEWLSRSKKGKLPKRLPKQKPVTADGIYEEMEKAYKKFPVIGEAEFYMTVVRRLKERMQSETSEDSAVSE